MDISVSCDIHCEMVLMYSKLYITFMWLKLQGPVTRSPP